jgi:hypothetical protein
MEKYQCSKCGKNSFKEVFRVTQKTVLFKDLDGSGTFYGNLCPKCTRERQREYTKKHKNINHRKYEKTINGFLVRAYRNMKTRIAGKRHKERRYKGMEILDKNIFYKWSKEDPKFIDMFKKWESKKYCRKLSPSVDRIDAAKGYTLDNIQWLTHSENSSKVRPNLRYRKTKGHNTSSS